MFLNKCILNKAEILEKTQDLKTDKPLVNLIKTASQLGIYITGVNMRLNWDFSSTEK